MNYKSYQQVLDLSGTKKTSLKVRPAQSGNSCGPKRRTKSGCMTCRSRKKKCDEVTEDGKCQACIRNFLDCCWPGEKLSQQPETETSPSKEVMMPKTPLVEMKQVVSCTPKKGASAYPSPISSPKTDFLEDTKKIQSLVLPPIKMKVDKPQKKAKNAKKINTGFIVTSFDSSKALCQIR